MLFRSLIVDDTQQNVQVLSQILRDVGYKVLAAFNGQDALNLLSKRIPDLILLDVMMPGMDGIELCGVIRERAETSSTPVLILSARGDAESVMHGMDAGANDFLPKPILHHDLVAKVRAMLDEVHSN
mgnify:FL=1